MKYSNALQLAFLACWTRKNESFNPNLFGVRHVKNSRSTFAVQQATQGDEDQSSSAPHPPENPPPDELLEKGIHFASLVRDSSEESTTILNGDNETAKLEEEARLAVIAAKEADEEEARRAEEVRLAQEALLAEETRVTEEERLGEEGRLKEKLRQEGEKGSQVEETDAENTVYETKPLISPEDAERAQEIANEATQKILNDFVVSDIFEYTKKTLYSLSLSFRLILICLF